MFKRDIDYIVKDGKVVIIDEFTGRMMDGRRWSDGLHQAVEAKEGVADRAREPDPRLDHLPELFPHVSQAFRHDRHRGDRGAGILRHLQDERGLDPDQRAGPAARRGRRILQEHHRQVRRDRQGDHGEAGKWASRSWSAPSRSRNRSCCPNFSSKRRHQARGAERPLPRAGGAYRRPGRPRSARSPSPPTWPAAAPTSSWAAISISASRTSSARWSRRPGARRGDRRRSAAEVAAEKQKVLAAGGLFVLGTERHESRRIDNQLRGRSGRQGDPGLSPLLSQPRRRSAAHLRPADRCSRG